MKRLAALFLLAAFSTLAQVPVALLPPSHQQFFLPNGAPNAGGCLFFFNSGTSTPAPTYTDVTGTILNVNPVTLDASGSATIYLQNQEYRVQYTNPPNTGFTCATGAGAQIFSQDGVSAFQVTSTTPSVMFAGVTTDPAGTAGEMVYRSDIPCFRVFTSFWDCLVQTTPTQTISNKTINTSTLNSPTIVTPTIGGTINQNGPATYAALPNFSIGGTVLNNLVVFNGTTGQVFQSSTSSGQGGANPALIGICVAVCGASGNAVIQQSGVVSCVFDGATTAGDYFQQSSTNAGQCHDAGATYPAVNQVLGRILTTNAASGAFQVDLFGAELSNANISVGNRLLNAQPNAAPLVGTGSAATIYSYTLPAGQTANLKALRFTIGWSHSTGTASVSYNLTINGQLACSAAFTSTGAQTMTCTVLNTGATTGVATSIESTSGGSTANANTITGLLWASPQTVLFTFNVANTDQVTPILWTAEAVQ